jgi:hypothetical protein
MRTHVVGLVGITLVLSLTAPAWADIPPSPPPGLKDTPGPRPLPIAVAGLAVALALAVGGLTFARKGGPPGLRAAALAAAAVVLVAATAYAFKAARDWRDHDALQAEYDRVRANWRSPGPVSRRRPASREARLAVAVFAWAPPNHCPLALPWPALAMDAGPDPQ